MKKGSKVLIGILAIIIVFCQPMLVMAENTFYTYTYDYWGIERESPNPYVPEKVVYGKDFGLSNFKEPQGLFARDNTVFIVDSGNNRIIECDGELNLVRVIENFTAIDVENTSFAYPQDVFMTENKHIYVCDTNNQRILHLDYDLNLVKLITRPEDASLNAGADFLPEKIVVDNADRIYLTVRNVNQGLMEFDKDGVFTGYVGANKVNPNMIDYIWKSYLATDAQKAQMVLFVPTEYNNIALDHKGFIYTTTSTLSDGTIANAIRNGISEGTGAPVRRLNSMGADILIRNGFYPPVGDIYFGSAGNVEGSSKFIDVVAMDNDTYAALDRTRGRIFAYDFQGNLLYAFGGLGNKAGYFQYPSAIESVGNTMLILDYRSGALTQMRITEYGQLINDGLMEYKRGNYDLSADKWQEVLKMNGNYDLAYIGIGRSLLRQGEYKKAMDYFELKMDFNNYSKAFQLYRKEMVEENVGYILLVAAILILLPKVIRIIKKFRKPEVHG